LIRWDLAIPGGSRGEFGPSDERSGDVHSAIKKPFPIRKHTKGGFSATDLRQIAKLATSK